MLIQMTKPSRKRVKSFNPCGSNILNTLFCTGRIIDSNLFLNIDIDSEDVILSSKSNQSLRVAGKKEYLKNTYFSCYILLTDQISLSGCLCFSKR